MNQPREKPGCRRQILTFSLMRIKLLCAYSQFSELDSYKAKYFDPFLVVNALLVSNDLFNLLEILTQLLFLVQIGVWGLNKGNIYLLENACFVGIF